jgi:hypothetical protein
MYKDESVDALITHFETEYNVWYEQSIDEPTAANKARADQARYTLVFLTYWARNNRFYV